MNVFEKLGSELNELGKKSKDMLEIMNLKTEYTQLENEKYIKLAKLGSLVYLTYNTDDFDHEILTKSCREISELEKQMKKITKNISNLQLKEIICPNCGTILTPEFIFCSNCGQKLHEENEEDKE